MPPRVVAAQNLGGGPGDWYGSLPPTTRLWATLCFASSTLAYLGLVRPFHLALLSRAVVLGRLQLWRPLTAACFLAPYSLKFVFELMWILQYGAALERGSYALRPGDYLWMLVFNASALSAASLLAPSLGLVFVASPLVFALVYVWSRHYPDQRVSLFGMIQLQSFYLPFAFLALTVVQGGSPIPDLLGIAVGHAWFFGTELYPRANGGRRLLPTPRWADWMALKVAGLGAGGGGGGGVAAGGGAAAAAAAAAARAREEQDDRFRAFRGQGQRLGGGAGGRQHAE
jgi:Derlin-2/3